MVKKEVKTKKNKRRNRKTKTNKKTNPLVYGRIYSSSCPHCVNMRDDWHNCVEKIGLGVQNYDIGDEIKHRDNSEELFAQRFGQRLVYTGVPTVFKIRRNRPIEYYNGERSSQNLYKWIMTK